MLSVANVVSAPMIEEESGNDQPLDLAWTNHANWGKLVGPR